MQDKPPLFRSSVARRPSLCFRPFAGTCLRGDACRSGAEVLLLVLSRPLSGGGVCSTPRAVHWISRVVVTCLSTAVPRLIRHLSPVRINNSVTSLVRPWAKSSNVKYVSKKKNARASDKDIQWTLSLFICIIILLVTFGFHKLSIMERAFSIRGIWMVHFADILVSLYNCNMLLGF